jgi:hypothetical protein
MPRQRKRKYTPASFTKEAERYFAKAEMTERPLTITGLCLHLKITRQTLLNYGELDEYKQAVGLAKLRVEAYLEECLFGNSVTGIIFNLKNNFGWKDKHETEITGKDGKDLIPILNVTTTRNKH